MVPLAIASGVGPYAGRAWGAGRLEPLRAAVEFGRRWALFCGLICYAVGATAAESLATLFTNDPKLTPLVVQALRVLPLGFASYGMWCVTNSVYNGIGRATTALLLTLFRTFGLSVPLAFLSARVLGGAWIFAALALSSAIGDLVGVRLLTRDRLCKRGFVPALLRATQT